MCPGIVLSGSLLHVHKIAQVTETVSNLNADPHHDAKRRVLWPLSHHVFQVLRHEGERFWRGGSASPEDPAWEKRWRPAGAAAAGRRLGVRLRRFASWRL